MTVTIYALLLLAICASVYPKMCTPDQWEGYAGSLGGYSDRGRPGMIRESMDIHYDFTNKRSAVYLNYANGRIENKFHIVIRYEGEVGHLFVVNMKESSCWMKKLDKEFRQACIPDGAQKLGSYYLGLTGGLSVTSYEVEHYGMTSILSVETAGDNIIPVTENVFGSLGGVAFVQGVGFANLKPGIKNETVFDVPEQCEPKEKVSMSQQLTREHYILAL